MRFLWQLELFALNPMHKMQFSKKIFGDSDKKKRIFAATNPTTPLNDAYHGGTSLFIWVYELRQLIFKAIQDIEISLLIKMIQVFSMEYGTFCSCVHIVAIAIK